jgi:hypothetical protein
VRVPLVVAVLAIGLPWTAGAATVPPAGAVPPAVGEPSTAVRTQALVVPVAGKYTALVPPWAVLPGKTLSLRAVATDAAGGSIDQTVLNAIPVT